MRKIRFFFACMAFLVTSMGLTYAQETYYDDKDYKPYPYMFVGINGGASASFTDYDFGDIITPMYGVSFGAYFTPVIGARAHVSGHWNKGGIEIPGYYTAIDASGNEYTYPFSETYDFKTLTGSVDLLINVTNIFRKNKDALFNFIILGGVGLAGSWDNDDFNEMTAGLDPEKAPTYPYAWDDNRLSHNLRLGMQFDFNVCKLIDVNLELAANNRADRVNSKTCDHDDWNVYGAVGVNFKFGYKKNERPAPPVVEEKWETRTDTIWYDDITYRTVPVEESIEKYIYYQIRADESDAASGINEVADFIKSHSNCKVSVTGYADKGTGNAKLNMGYSKKRAENVTSALTEAGVDASIITTDYKGDTVQLFEENDKNRVSVVKATGEGTKQEEVVTKKYRLEEKRYRVQ